MENAWKAFLNAQRWTVVPSILTNGFAVRVATVELTPEVCADALLHFNTRNRRQKHSLAERYGKDMQEGRWPFTGEPILIAADDTIIDGQHRMMGCRDSGAKFCVLLVRGVSDSASLVVDSGNSRSTADGMAIDKEENVFCLASCCGHVRRYELGRFGWTNLKVSALEARDTLIRHPGIRVSVQATHVRNISVPGASLAAVHYLGSREMPDEADMFLRGVITGEDLQSHSPILALRNLATGSVWMSYSPSKKLGVIVRAWNHYAVGGSVRSLRPIEGPWPAVTGCPLDWLHDSQARRS